MFYNYLLKCFVLIDLKRGMVKHQDIGQMNMYLNYFKSEVGGKGDSEPVGIVLGANKDDLVVQYATQGISACKVAAWRCGIHVPEKRWVDFCL